MEKYVLCKNGFGIKTILVNGYSEFRDLPEQHFLDQGYKVIKPEEFDLYFDNYVKEISENWSEISEKDYIEALEVLPPIKWYDGGFYIGEPTFSHLYGFYQKIDNQYYSCTASVFTKRDQLLNSLNQWRKQQKQVSKL